jgi:hypothetical protein
LARFFWRDDIRHRGPLNVGNDREIPVINIARHIQELVPGATIKFMPPVPQDPTNRRPDLTIAKTVLPGWKAEIPYEEGIRRTLEWFRSELANGVEPLQAPEPLFEIEGDEQGTRPISRASADRSRRKAVQQSGRRIHSV